MKLTYKEGCGNKFINAQHIEFLNDTTLKVETDDNLLLLTVYDVISITD